MNILIIFLLLVVLGLLLFSLNEYLKTKRTYTKFMKEKKERDIK